MSTVRDTARWALRDDRKLSKVAKLVWYSLDSRGEDPHPSVTTLAADCGRGTSKATVREGIRELEREGWLRVYSRTTASGDADTNRYVLLSPAQEGVGQSLTQGVGQLLTQGGSATDPEDQLEDQRVEDQRNLSRSTASRARALSSPDTPKRYTAGTAAAEVQDPRLAAAWVTAAHAAHRCGFITSPDDHAVTCWLQRTFQVQANGKRRDVAQFARYLARCTRAAPDEMAKLAASVLDGTTWELGGEVSGELLTVVRAAAGDRKLSAAHSRLCGRIAAAAEHAAHPGMTTYEATSAGIGLRVPEEGNRP